MATNTPYLAYVLSRKGGASDPLSRGKGRGGSVTLEKYVGATPTTETIYPDSENYRLALPDTWIQISIESGSPKVTPIKELTSDVLSKLIPSQISKSLSLKGVLTPKFNDLSHIVASSTAPQTQDQDMLNALPPPFSTLPSCPHWDYKTGVEMENKGDGLLAWAVSDSYMRIGSVLFERALAPMSLDIELQNEVDAQEILRQSTSMKRVGGTVRKRVSFNIVFPDLLSQSLEMTPFLKQCRRAPFMPVIQGELMRRGIDALAIERVTIATMRDDSGMSIPEALVARVEAWSCNVSHYLLSGNHFDETINYPLLTLWLAAGRDWSPILGPREVTPVQISWNGILGLSVPSRDWLDLLKNNVTSDNPEEFRKKYFTGGDSLLEIAGQALQGDTTSFDQLPSSGVAGVSKLTDGHYSLSSIGIPMPLDGNWIVVELTPSLAYGALTPGNPSYATKILTNATLQENVIIASRDLDETSSSSGIIAAATRASVIGHQAYDINNPGAQGRTALLTDITTNRVVPGKILALYKVGDAQYISPGAKLTQEFRNASLIGSLDASQPVYEDPFILTDFYINSVSATIANTLADVTPSDLEEPIYQCVGSSDVYLSLQGEILESELGLLEDIYEEISALAVDYRGQVDGSPYGGFCKVTNDIAELIGLETAIPVSLQSSTVDQQPELRQVTIGFVAFNKDQRRIGTPGDFSGRNKDGNPSVDVVTTFATMAQRAFAYENYEKKLQHIDLYPDIQPPHWSVLAKWLTDIKEGNVWDENNGVGKPGYEFLLDWPYTPDYIKESEELGLSYFWSFLNSVPLTAIKNRPGFVDPDFYCDGQAIFDPKKVLFDPRSGFTEKVLNSLYDGKSNHTSLYFDTYHGGSATLSHVNDTTKSHAPFKIPFTPRNKAMLAARLSEDIIPTMERDEHGVMQKVAEGAILATPTMASNADQGPMRGKASNNLLPVHLNAGSKTSESSKDKLTGEPIEPHSVQTFDTILKGKKSEVIQALRQAATENGVPLPVAARLAIQESGADPTQVTGEAFGLLQLKKSTFAGKGDIFNPLDNARAGLKYLSNLYTGYYNGFLNRPDIQLNSDEKRITAWEMAACAYNTGPGVSDNHGLDRYEWIAKTYGASNFLSKITELRGTGKNGVFLARGNGKERLPARDYAKNVTQDLHSRIATNITNLKKEIAIPTKSSAFSNFTDALNERLAPEQKVMGDIEQILSAPGTFSGSLLDSYYKKYAAGGSLYTPISIDSLNKAFTVTEKSVETALHNIPDDLDAAWASLFDLGIENSASEEKAPNDHVWDYDRAAHDSENGEDVFWSLRRSDLSGRLLQAFPTMLPLIVNGGDQLFYYQIFDTFYGLHSPMSAQTFSSRVEPADTCVIRFADPYNQLSAVSGAIAQDQAQDTRADFSAPALIEPFLIALGLDKTTLLQRITEESRALLVRPGNRLHLRLGYGSNARELPVVFNGAVTQVSKVDDVLAVTALGDGYELTNQISSVQGDKSVYTDIGVFGQGKELRNIILDLFAKGDHENGALLTAGFFGGTNPYGIEHFGNVTRQFLGRDSGELGVNIYSGYDGEPVNVTPGYEDGFNVFGVAASSFDGGQDLGQKIKDYLDPEGAKFLDAYACNQLWRMFNGELLTGIEMEDATPWEIIETLRRASLDYVAAPEPFSLRSTLFFGKDWWPFHYSYDYNGIRSAGEGLDTATPASWEPYFRRRPFMQFHLAHSGHNLIAARIEATAEGWANSVQSIGSTGGLLIPSQMESSMEMTLDINIYLANTRKKLVKSGLTSTATNRLVSGFLHGSGLFSGFHQTNVLNNHALGVLHDEVREMYQGELYLLGNAYMRPRHTVHFRDEMQSLGGLIEIKDVTHSFTPRGGFVTTISPDCVGFAKDTQKFALMGHLSSYAARAYAFRKFVQFARTEEGSRLIRRSVGSVLRLIGETDDKFRRKVGVPFRKIQYHADKWMRGKFEATVLAKAQNLKAKYTNHPELAVDVPKINSKEFFKKKDPQLLFTDKVDVVLKTMLEEADKSEQKELKTFIRNRQINHVLVKGKSYDALVERIVATLKAGKNTPEQMTKAVEKILKQKFRIVDSADKIHEPGTLTHLAKYLQSGKTPRITKEGIKQFMTETIAKSIAKFKILENIDPQKLLKVKKGLQVIAWAKTMGRGAKGKLYSLDNPIVDLLRDTESLTKGLSAEEARQIRLELLEAASNKNLVRAATKLSTSQKELEEATLELGKLSKGDEGYRKAQTEVAKKTAKYTAALADHAAALKGKDVLKIFPKVSKLGKTLGITGKFAKGNVVTFIIENALSSVTGALIDNLNREMLRHHPMQISPLLSCGKEFSAGINGHHGLVIGEHLGPFDNLVEAFYNNFFVQVPGFLLGLEDPRYGAYSVYGTDTQYSQYRDYLKNLGVSDVDSDPSVITEKNNAEIQMMIARNAWGPDGPDVIPLTTTSTTSSQTTPSSTTPSLESYESQTNTAVGKAYAKTVRHFADKIRTHEGTSLGKGDCAAELHQQLNRDGVNNWPSLGKHGGAELLIGILQKPPYDANWKKVGGSETSMINAPQGAVCVWTASSIGNQFGHVGIVYHQDGQTYLLGNFDARSVRNVTLASGKLAKASAYFLPR